MTPTQGGGNFEVKTVTVKLMYFLKKSSLLPGIDQTNQHLVMMTKEGSNKIVNFMTPGAGVLVLVRGHISHIVKILNF